MTETRVTLKQILPHLAYEPAYGYFNRLAAYAEIPPQLYARICGLSLRRIFMGWQNAELAQLAQIEEKDLAAGTPRLVEGDLNDPKNAIWAMPNGATLRSRYWWPTARRFCIGCLEDAREVVGRPHAAPHTAGRRFFWDLRLFGACPIHGELLQDVCTQCQRKRPSGPKSRYCECGCDLAAQKREVLAADDVHADRYAFDRLTSNAPSTPHVLSEISWCAADFLCLEVGMQISSPARPVSRPLEQRCVWRSEGLRFVEDWFNLQGTSSASLRASALHVSADEWRALSRKIRNFAKGPIIRSFADAVEQLGRQQQQR